MLRPSDDGVNMRGATSQLYATQATALRMAGDDGVNRRLPRQLLQEARPTMAANALSLVLAKWRDKNIVMARQNPCCSFKKRLQPFCCGRASAHDDKR